MKTYLLASLLVLLTGTSLYGQDYNLTAEQKEDAINGRALTEAYLRTYWMDKCVYLSMENDLIKYVRHQYTKQLEAAYCVTGMTQSQFGEEKNYYVWIYIDVKNENYRILTFPPTLHPLLKGGPSYPAIAPMDDPTAVAIFFKNINKYLGESEKTGQLKILVNNLSDTSNTPQLALNLTCQTPKLDFFMKLTAEWEIGKKTEHIISKFPVQEDSTSPTTGLRNITIKKGNQKYDVFSDGKIKFIISNYDVACSNIPFQKTENIGPPDSKNMNTESNNYTWRCGDISYSLTSIGEKMNSRLKEMAGKNNLPFNPILCMQKFGYLTE